MNATLNTTSSIAVGTALVCTIGNGPSPATMDGVVVALNDTELFVETTDSTKTLYRVNRLTMKDRDGDRWAKKVERELTYRNVYADGTVSTNTHGTYIEASQLSRYYKTRVGILETVTEGLRTVSVRVFPTVPQLRNSSNPNGYNPYA